MPEIWEVSGMRKREKRNAEGDGGEGRERATDVLLVGSALFRLHRLSGRGARLSGSIHQGLGRGCGDRRDAPKRLFTIVFL